MVLKMLDFCFFLAQYFLKLDGEEVMILFNFPISSLLDLSNILYFCADVL